MRDTYVAWGLGHDLKLCDNSFITKGSMFRVGTTYKLDEDKSDAYIDEVYKAY
jgi:hypothetical protein